MAPFSDARAPVSDVLGVAALPPGAIVSPTAVSAGVGVAVGSGVGANVAVGAVVSAGFGAGRGAEVGVAVEAAVGQGVGASVGLAVASRAGLALTVGARLGATASAALAAGATPGCSLRDAPPGAAVETETQDTTTPIAKVAKTKGSLAFLPTRKSLGITESHVTPAISPLRTAAMCFRWPDGFVRYTQAQMTSPTTGQAAPDVDSERSSRNGRSARSARPKPVPDFSPEGMQRSLDEVVHEVAERYPQAELEPLDRAFEFAREAHEGQTRASGEPYVSHPLAVSMILAELGLDPVAVQAALLHDIPEDTEYSLGDVEERFGKDVALLVDGVTKLGKFSTLTHEEQQAENIRKMFLAMADDIRVVLIKLADRLHNMRTLDALPPDKQLRIARQTAEIYAPLAERLGVWQIKWELEDLSFKFLDPDSYRKLAGQLETHRKAREAYVQRAMDALAEELKAADINAELSGRPKHIFSIFKKMNRKGAQFSEIYDVHALRVLVDDVRDCYAALGVVHSMWRPIPGQFDDYIAMPKNNMYQSLHTAVVAVDGKPLEVQIRSHDMHRVSEVGVAAHWRYKEGSRADRAYDAKLAWVRQLMEWQRDVSDATEFIEGVKLDIFQDQVFVFTPKGDVKDMPAGATPLDFAYRIHTEVGHACIGAKVNNRLVPLDSKLKNGDIVEIVTTKSAHGPSRDWLNIVTTSHAREKIRQWFKRQQRDENITHGKSVVDRELHRLARTSLDKIPGDTLREISEQYNMKTVDDFFAAVGYGAISAQQVVSRMDVVDDVHEVPLPQSAPPSTQVGGIRVRGVGDLLVRFSKCCHPIPGDPIVGFITRGRGVTVHIGTCPTVVNERAVERLVDVEWETAAQQTYPIAVIVEAYDRTGLLSEITNVLVDDRINIVAASVTVHKDHRATVRATLEVASVAQLSRVLAHLEQLKDVYSVQRDRT
ncbi:MAG: bifunctional (p)ppGpp synthetase/guanosine-3',5'-bis(diphosphate) 3'-pyrophosphohydrolase [Chloroflexota bacterium]